jgi:YegS/Rv2252/BmrU family lipid kinase
VYHLIVNPEAGRGRTRALLPAVEAFLERYKWPFQRYLTTKSGDATEIACQLPADANVLVLGGDGTLHEVALACVNTPRTVGILPAGSGDDFAFGLGLPRDPLAVLSRLLPERTRQVDVGRVNGVPFVNVFGVGFDADIAAAIRNAPGFIKGRAAYIYTIFRTLSKLQVQRVNVTVDGQAVYSGPSLLVTTHNGPRSGGSFRFAPDARVDDGALDVVVIGDFQRLSTVMMLPRVIQGTHLRHPKIQLFRGQRIEMTWEHPRPGHTEGELVAPERRFVIELLPKALHVFAAS